jgi:hypothetical protein
LFNNYSAIGAKLTQTATDLTDDTYIKAELLAFYGSQPATTQGITASYAYDYKLKVVAN